MGLFKRKKDEDNKTKCEKCGTELHDPERLKRHMNRLVSIQPEGTFGRLRYFLGGDRPSQTTHQTLFPDRITAEG